MGERSKFNEGKLEALPTADELWFMAGQLAQTYQKNPVTGQIKYQNENGEFVGLDEFGEDMQEWSQAAMNLARFAKAFQKDVTNSAISAVEVGQDYYIKGMSPNYLNGVKVNVLEVRDGYAYSELLDETGHKTTIGSRTGIPFTCLVPAA